MHTSVLTNLGFTCPLQVQVRAIFSHHREKGDKDQFPRLPFRSASWVPVHVYQRNQHQRLSNGNGFNVVFISNFSKTWRTGSSPPSQTWNVGEFYGSKILKCRHFLLDYLMCKRLITIYRNDPIENHFMNSTESTPKWSRSPTNPEHLISWSERQNPAEKKGPLQQMVPRQLDNHMQANEVQTLPHSKYKN